jgi:TonB-linked SusC/RagA family outer membrane protein
LEFNKKLDADNHLNAVYGWRYYDNIFESDYENIHNTGSNHNTTISNSGDYRKVDGIFNHTKSLAHFLSLKYNFAERYFLNAAVSMDASSRFGKDAEDGIHLFGSSWGLFPSVGGAWLVTAEEFMKNLTFVDLLKIRAGYGITGNDGIKDYEALAYFTGLQYISDLNGIVLSKLENTKIQWETTAKLNAGFDIDLFKNRLRLGFDYFISNTSNLLVLKDLPEISGLEKYWANDGKLRNTGYELSFEVKALNLKKFQWEAGASVGHYKNEIVSLPEGKSYTTSVYDGEVLTTVGQPVGVFYGYKTKGVFSTNEDAAAEGLSKRNADGAYSPFMAGDIHFEEVLEDGIINEADKQIIGDPNPDIYGNIFSKWTYGNWTLNAIFTYSYGNDVYNYYRSKLEAGSDFNNQTMAMLNRWTAAGQTTAQPKATYGDPMGNARFSDRWIEDGSYLRLKTLSLAYDVPIKDNIYVHGLNIWVSANNLFTLTKYLGMDPEFSSGNSVFYQGVDAGLLPLTQSFYVGIKLNL